MEIYNVLDRYQTITTLSKNLSSSKNKENLKAIKIFYDYYGIKMADVDSDLIEDSFKGDTKFFFNEFKGDTELGDISIIHDKFNRKILFFQNNVPVFHTTLSNIELTISRMNIALGFIRLCNFYMPKRLIKTSYTTTGHFNPDFPISGKPLAVLTTVNNPDTKDRSLMYAKTINTEVDNYIISPEIITYNKGEKVENIVDTSAEWIDGKYINAYLYEGYMIIKDRYKKKKIPFDK